MPLFRGRRVNRGHSPMGGTSQPPAPLTRRMPTGPAPQPPQAQASIPKTKKQQPYDANKTLAFGMTLDRHKRALEELETIAGSFGTTADTHSAALSSGLLMRKKVNHLQKEYDEMVAQRPAPKPPQPPKRNESNDNA